MTLAERCRAQAGSMELEGWYVCRNVLEMSAERLEALEQAIKSLLPLARGFADQYPNTPEYAQDIIKADKLLNANKP